MSSPNLTNARAQELMMNANLSGSFEGNYGATAGMRMAYEIDTRLGRPALTATLITGSHSFISTYMQTCLRDGYSSEDRQTSFALIALILSTS